MAGGVAFLAAERGAAGGKEGDRGRTEVFSHGMTVGKAFVPAGAGRGPGGTMGSGRFHRRPRLERRRRKKWERKEGGAGGRRL